MTTEKPVPRCYTCKEIITFDAQHVGKNGKKIPLDPSTKTPHRCKTEDEFEEEQLTEENRRDQAEVAQEKSTAAVVPLTTTALVKILVWGDVKDLEEEYNIFVAKIRKYGARIHGSTYQVGSKPSIAIFFEIPNAAVGEVEK